MLKGNQPSGEQEIIVNFSIEQYPFTSVKRPLPTYFKTIEIFSFTNSDLQRLTSIHHRNLVNLKRIAKTYLNNEYKQKQESNLLSPTSITSIDCIPSGYYLYYESVQSGMHNRKRLAQGLNRIAKFLIQNDIFYEIRQCDIGYDQFNQIKVFVPPLAILGKSDRSQKELTEEDVYESINKFLNSNLSDTREKIDRINEIDQQLKQIKRQLQLRQKQKIKKQQRIRYNEQRKIREQQSKQERINVRDYERNQQRLFNNQFLQEDIQEQILNFARNQFSQQSPLNHEENKIRINHLNIQRIPEDKRKSMPHEVMRHSGKNQGMFNFPIQMVNWGQHPRQKMNNIPFDIQKQTQQKFQQNINCINIYHNTKPKQVVQIKTKPAYILNHYQNQRNISGAYDDVSDSLDTYELQIGEMRQMPKMQPRSKLRHTVLPSSQRNLSCETNQKSSRRDKKKWIYGSAGHKQYAEYVKNTTRKKSEKQEKQQKQQKPLKKSNIYEQSFEESMTDIKIDKASDNNIINIVQDRNQSGQNVARNYQSHPFVKNEQVSTNIMYKSQHNPHPDWNKNYRKSFQNQISNTSVQARQRSEKIAEMTKRKIGGQIHQKVNQAVLKTKAAIAILKMVRTQNSNTQK